MSSRSSTLALALVCFAHASWGGNTAGIFGAAVHRQPESIQYRAGFDPDTENLSQRIHYQRPLNDQGFWRLIAQSTETDRAAGDFGFVQGELYQRIDAAPTDWPQAYRVELRLRNRGLPHHVGAAWATERQLADRWSLRLLGRGTLPFGPDAPDGLFLETRLELGYKLTSACTTALQGFSAYGSTDNLRGASDQLHQLGPTVRCRMGKHWQFHLGALFGLTAPTPDLNGRFWLGRRL